MSDAEGGSEILIAPKRASGERLQQIATEERIREEKKPAEIKAVLSDEALGVFRDAFQRMEGTMGEFSGRVAEAAEIQTRMTTGDYRLPLPSEAEPQREYVRHLLHGIERSNRDTLDFSISSLVKGLEASLDEMDPYVAREVQARLAVHDCAALIKQADGWISRKTEEVGPGLTIGSAASNAEVRGHSLNRGIIRLFLKEGLPGMRIAEAWDLLQDANFSYRKLVVDINRAIARTGGREFLKVKDIHLKELADKQPVINFYTDPEEGRKNAVRQFLVNERLGGGRGAEKSFELAEKLATATLENSVFNRAGMTGNDELAEIIGLLGWRKRRGKPGRARGPRIHEDNIPGFGVSWLRAYHQRPERDNPKEPLYTKDINIEKIEEGNWKFHCSVIVTRYKLLQNLLLDRRPKPKIIDRKTLEDAVIYFNTADPIEYPEKGETLGHLKLRLWWLAGVVDVALADENLEWNTEAFVELERAVTREQLSEEAGTFLRRDQWEGLEKMTNLERRLILLEAKRGFGGAFKGVVTGGRRK